MEYNRQSIRLNNWDYGKGIYFVTIDVEDKLKLFWDVGAESHFCPDGNKKGKGGYGNEKGEGGYGNPPVRKYLNDRGLMINKSIVEMPIFYPDVDIDEFIIMPDHIHIIIKIVGAESHFCTGLSLPQIIQRFKILTTNRYIDGVKNNNWPRFNKRLWQRNYFEKIVRDEKELQNIRNYIKRNPFKLFKERADMGMRKERADMGIRPYGGRGE